ncbi:hypothetical protein ACTFIW_003330 [Dictyostelium discoideum]
MSSMLSSDSSNVDVDAIVLSVNAQTSLGIVCHNNFSKEIYGFEVLLPIKIKDSPKMFDETETERVRKIAKSIRKNNEAKQSFSNSKSSSGSNGRSNNFNGSPSNVASGINNTKSANGINNRFQKNKK